MDCRPWFWPITPRKYFVLFLIACAIAGIVVSDLYFRWLERSLQITRSYMLPVLIISVCAEPLIIMLILPVAKIPDIPQEEIDIIMKKEDLEAGMSKARNEPKGPFETALVIPCHDTDEAAIKTTLDSAFPFFRPRDIFIVDNGRSRHPKHPTCNFRDYLRSIHPDIVYIWSPIGSKNAAQLVGALAAKDYKYIMTVDDDVCIPSNFCPPVEMIDDKFKAVAYPLKAMDAQCNVPLFLVAWQDVEYRLSGLAKLAEDRLCGVQFPHGAGW
jgi:glycosyl transferase family 2